MRIGIWDHRDNTLTVCCITEASNIIGLERSNIYRRLSINGVSVYKCYTLIAKTKEIEHKKRGIPFRSKY
jgi:hypothetical protein